MQKVGRVHGKFRKFNNAAFALVEGTGIVAKKRMAFLKLKQSPNRFGTNQHANVLVVRINGIDRYKTNAPTHRKTRGGNGNTLPSFPLCLQPKTTLRAKIPFKVKSATQQFLQPKTIVHGKRTKRMLVHGTAVDMVKIFSHQQLKHFAHPLRFTGSRIAHRQRNLASRLTTPSRTL